MTKDEKSASELLLEKHPGISVNRTQSGLLEVFAGPESAFGAKLEVVVLPLCRKIGRVGVSMHARQEGAGATVIDAFVDKGASAPAALRLGPVTVREALELTKTGVELFATYLDLSPAARQEFDKLPGAANKATDNVDPDRELVVTKDGLTVPADVSMRLESPGQSTMAIARQIFFPSES